MTDKDIRRPMSSSRQQRPDRVVLTPPAIPMDIDWSGQHVLVIGLGESGLAACRWLVRRGARVTAVDSRAEPPMAQAARALGSASCDVRTGVAAPFSPALLEGVHWVVPSPGLSPHAHKGSPIAELLIEAKRQEIPVVGEIDVFEWAIHHAAHASSALATEPDLALPLELPKVLAITGTNGKTTTTQMTVALLRRAGFDAQEAGNISPSLLDAVMMREDESRFPQVWVLELSSFQLALARHFQPSAAALLNVSEDHLDWHLDMADYIAAKQRVFGIGCDPETSGVVCVANRQDAAVVQCVANQSKVVTFGANAPGACGDLGLVEEGLLWMAMRDINDEERLHRLMPADALRVRGRHNAMNALAALALCRAVTPALAPLLHACREFRGGAHRMQWVAHVSGVDFVDDSKGTNVGATAAALSGIGLPVVLIAGGEGKGQDFSPLKAPMAAHAKALIAIGRDGPLLAEVARSAGIPVVMADTMHDAVQQGYRLAAEQAGHGVVLLSPACASFDMFANYVERAHAFRSAVDQLALEQGVAC